MIWPLLEDTIRKGDKLIQDGDLLIVYESHKQMKAVTVSKGGEFQNRYGLFAHNDWIGKPFGSKVTGKKGGFVHLLAPSPQLWTLVLTHRTQILYIMDISFVLAYLEVRPGCVVMESGTGSGSLTTALARAAAPTGHIYSFDFHEQRAEAARKDFERIGLSNFITVTVRDTQGEGFPEEFANEVDAVFLDLPQPWLVIPSVAKSLRADSPVCSFSPCMEQVQRTCEALTTTEFRDLRTFEVLVRTYETHEEYFGTDIGLDIVNNEIEDATLHTPGSSPPHKRLCPTEMKTTSAEEKTTSNKSEVSGKDNWMKKGPKKGRGRGEQPQGSKCSIVARPEAEAKGHTGYLTFARRAV
ncbi:tRNA (adenine57-N1/adenine58-N1)-methyltransferase catalytic subunit [Marchantia polymorpha subsp. ruderalis]|uniref:tRNA (adenine(58)-N(1))-methyltransferase n=2 Tax=Marchantia polymorpha TaxID=3197 RepID=A0A176W335_MARPO|nr:hypothetical protein AXG93_4542s1170 [Marchantia polymorpha subsp. ruderalis]PTQ38170.1 hypothetical protein MARPO_0053s0094 [Marchantia polymorpha]BBN13969.1 hypothetical protein Mp_6g07810 [Marchantia polymorpha subsp. ruderalis]|eukprot:PTQ38170.1 hypothetical protein MARPO_0053s0094 [Marchantia polymorpha]